MEQLLKDDEKKDDFQKRVFVGGGMALAAIAVILIGPPFSSLVGFALLIALLIEWVRLSMKPFGDQPHLTLGLLVLGFLYVGLSGFWLLDVLGDDQGWRTLFPLLLMVTTTDIAAYFVGKNMGTTKLWPSVSPNKTWAGFWGGMIVGSFVGIVSLYLFQTPHISLWIVPVLILVAQGGDLFESKIKRIVKVKDSGNLIPGHGGLLDRLDSLLAVAFFLALWNGF